MHLAILSCGNGWHVRDLKRAAQTLGQAASVIDFRRIHASLPHADSTLDGFDAVIVRTMPPGSLEQVVFRMDVLHRCRASGRRVVNSPSALETCIDKYLACARLDAAGLPVPRTSACQDADGAM